MKNVLPPVKLEMDDDADEVYDDYDEEGIHVFVQGGGGESRDINHNDEDVSPNDSGPIKQAFNYNTEARKEKKNDTAVREKSRSPPNTTASSEIPGKTPNLSDSDFYNRMRELNNERNLLLSDIEEEDKHRKWYCEQLEVIAQKIQSIHVGEKYNRQSDMARRQLEFEAKRIQNSFEQSMGDNDQIVQRQEVRLRKIQEIETEMIKLQQQHRQQSERNKVAQQENEIQERKGDTATQKEEAESVDSSDSAASAVSIATQTATGQNDAPNMSIAEDPNASVNLSSLYHGAWPMTPPKKDLEFRQEGGSGQNSSQPQDLASIMSFNSINTGNNSQGPAPSQPAPVTLHQPPPMVPQQDPSLVGQHPQQLGTKVEMVYSLLSMLGTHDKDDMSRTLLAMSSSQDSCIAMRQSGCMPLLIQLLHGSDKDSGLLGNTRGSKSARARAAAALHNIVHSHPDDKRGRREARVLRLLEQIRAHCDQLRESTSDEEEEGKNSKAGIRTQDMDHHPGPAVAALMKLSFDEEHRHAICSLGGVQAIAELIEVDSEINGNTSEQYNVTMRRYGCMALTNLTFGDGTNKALLCSMKGFMEALVYQLQPSCEDLCQVAASVLRNLSWKADLASKKTLREVGAGTTLMKAAMAVKKEATLKSILSALWNLSAHGSENKADICAVDGALEFLVSTLTYKSPSKTMAVVENGGGILRNISSHITVREDYRQILRRHGCLQILLKQLRSTSLTIVSNACGTLWNLSARCLEDQKALWDMGAVGMLRNLVNSKHQMISMGSSAALKNLLAACPSIKDMKMDQKSHLNRPTLHVRKQRALEAEIDQSLSETCENLESPRDSPTENVRTEKDQTRFVFPANVNVISNDVEPRRPLARGPVIPRSTSGENTPVTENKLRSPHRVARSGSQDSVGSTHSDISHDRNRFHYAMKKCKKL
ncbi:hypothetical protein KUTeg_010735 [Tegillarca granosa]|uniref:Adenomatous polyposis coli protein n=1 Tax=Tegillarca granosa TaxID=220873 RepID=A0ABQ9F566_TEGGR|nr:hypothetical protein KUTeg_010735 [Tegillarca granosa]